MDARRGGPRVDDIHLRRHVVGLNDARGLCEKAMPLVNLCFSNRSNSLSGVVGHVELVHVRDRLLDAFAVADLRDHFDLVVVLIVEEHRVLIVELVHQCLNREKCCADRCDT